MDAKSFREWRARTELTQAVVADKLHVTRQTIINWETGATPVPHYVGAICEIWENELRKRDDYGPVTLVYTDVPMFQNAYGAPVVPLIKNELYPNNKAALARYDALGKAAANAFIVDEAGNFIFNMIDLMKRAEPPRVRRPRLD
jgi:hypothetical protein